MDRGRQTINLKNLMKPKNNNAGTNNENNRRTRASTRNKADIAVKLNTNISEYFPCKEKTETLNKNDNTQQNDDDDNRETAISKPKPRTRVRKCNNLTKFLFRDPQNIPEYIKSSKSNDDGYSIRANASTDESDDFEIPVKKIKKPLTSQASKTTKTKTLKRRQRQPKISSALLRNEELFSEITAQHCLAENFSPDDIQMALAISSSEYNSQNPSNTAPEQQSVNLHDILSDDKELVAQNIQEKLKQYGFRTAPKEDYSAFTSAFCTRNPYQRYQRFKPKWHNKFTALTLRNADMQLKKLNNKIANFLSKQYTTKVSPPSSSSSADNHCIESYICRSALLSKYQINNTDLNLKILKKLDTIEESCGNGKSSELLLSNYFVVELFEISHIKAGYLLKKWKSIQGRDLSPDGKCSENQTQNKMRLEKLYDDLEQFYSELRICSFSSDNSSTSNDPETQQNGNIISKKSKLNPNTAAMTNNTTITTNAINSNLKNCSLFVESGSQAESTTTTNAINEIQFQLNPLVIHSNPSRNTAKSKQHNRSSEENNSNVVDTSKTDSNTNLNRRKSITVDYAINLENVKSKTLAKIFEQSNLTATARVSDNNIVTEMLNNITDSQVETKQISLIETTEMLSNDIANTGTIKENVDIPVLPEKIPALKWATSSAVSLSAEATKTTETLSSNIANAGTPIENIEIVVSADKLTSINWSPPSSSSSITTTTTTATSKATVSTLTFKSSKNRAPSPDIFADSDEDAQTEYKTANFSDSDEAAEIQTIDDNITVFQLNTDDKVKTSVSDSTNETRTLSVKACNDLEETPLVDLTQESTDTASSDDVLNNMHNNEDINKIIEKEFDNMIDGDTNNISMLTTIELRTDDKILSESKSIERLMNKSEEQLKGKKSIAEELHSISMSSKRKMTSPREICDFQRCKAIYKSHNKSRRNYDCDHAIDSFEKEIFGLDIISDNKMERRSKSFSGYNSRKEATIDLTQSNDSGDDDDESRGADGDYGDGEDKEHASIASDGIVNRFINSEGEGSSSEDFLDCIILSDDEVNYSILKSNARNSVKLQRNHRKGKNEYNFNESKATTMLGSNSNDSDEFDSFSDLLLQSPAGTETDSEDEQNVNRTIKRTGKNKNEEDKRKKKTSNDNKDNGNLLDFSIIDLLDFEKSFEKFKIKENTKTAKNSVLNSHQFTFDGHEAADANHDSNLQALDDDDDDIEPIATEFLMTPKKFNHLESKPRKSCLNDINLSAKCEKFDFERSEFGILESQSEFETQTPTVGRISVSPKRKPQQDFDDDDLMLGSIDNHWNDMQMEHSFCLSASTNHLNRESFQSEKFQEFLCQNDSQIKETMVNGSSHHIGQNGDDEDDEFDRLIYGTQSAKQNKRNLSGTTTRTVGRATNVEVEDCFYGAAKESTGKRNGRSKLATKANDSDDIDFNDFDDFDRLIYGTPPSKQSNCLLQDSRNGLGLPSDLDKLLTGEISFKALKPSPSPLLSPIAQKDKTPTKFNSVAGTSIAANKNEEKLAEEYNEMIINGNVYITRVVNEAKPKFSDYSDAELLKQLYNFGIKPLKRHQAIKILEYIYNQTHPILLPKTSETTIPSGTADCMQSNANDGNYEEINETSSDNDDDDDVNNKHAVRTMMTENRNFFNLKDCDGTKLMRFSRELSAELRDNQEFYILQTNISKKTPRPLLPLHIAWFNLLCSNKQLHEHMLLYNPIDLQEIYLFLKSLGYRYDPKDMKIFFDQRCIIFRYDLTPLDKQRQANARRHVRKSKTKPKETITPATVTLKSTRIKKPRTAITTTTAENTRNNVLKKLPTTLF